VQTPKNVNTGISLNEVFFRNIQLNPGIPFSPDDFSVTVNGQHPPFLSGTILQQPIRYSYLNNETFEDLSPGFLIGAFSTTTIVVNFSLPANHSVSQLSIGVRLSDAYFALPLRNLIYCSEGCSTTGPGGNRPVVLEVTTENKNKRNNNVNEANTQASSALRVFPNPSKGTATVVIPGDGLKGELRLEDVTGKLIYRKINTTGNTVTLQNLKTGFYLLRYTDQDSGKQYIEKLIVQ
jgi:Secretion system C-terminal sorting domain